MYCIIEIFSLPIQMNILLEVIFISQMLFLKIKNNLNTVLLCLSQTVRVRMAEFANVMEDALAQMSSKAGTVKRKEVILYSEDRA